MIIDLLSLALLTLYASLAVVALFLLRRRGWQRLAGALLLVQALLFATLQVVLSVFPVMGLEPPITFNVPATLANVAVTIGAVGGVALLVWLAARVLQHRAAAGRALRGPLIALLAGLPLVALSATYGLWQLSTPDRVRERDPNKREIIVPEGFSANVFLDREIDNPTALAFGAADELFVGDIDGTVWVAADADADGVADDVRRFADGFRFLTGLVWHAGELYVASQGKIEALSDSDGDGLADSTRLLVDGLPSMVYVPHTNNALTLGPDGRLYFGVGSTTAGEVEQERLAAAILSVNPDGSDLQVFARGLSNSFAVSFNSQGHMFAGDNQPNSGVSQNAGDELNYIVEGGHYGYPYFFGEPPEEGSTRGPIVSFPPHSSPNGLSFYQAAQFPRPYYDNAFVALWSLGEVARVELAQSPGGEYLSRTSTFASGFVYPLAVTIGPAGSLYVADFGTSAVYRITYSGG